MEDLFPYKVGVEYSRLMTTPEGSYSITRRRDALRVIDIVKSIFHKPGNIVITDATACIGGDTLNFALNFENVHSIEINVKNFEALKNNVSVYDLKNVVLHYGDSTKIFDWNTDILYVDPPWGGKDYRKTLNLDLFLSHTRLDIWLEEILTRENRPKCIVLKLPANYNFSRLHFLANIDYIKPFQIRSYFLIIIGVHTASLKTDRAE
jgi:hypothetical protein